MSESRDKVFCDDGGLWVRDPRGNCRPFDINDYEALEADLTEVRLASQMARRDRDRAEAEAADLRRKIELAHALCVGTAPKQAVGEVLAAALAQQAS